MMKLILGIFLTIVALFASPCDATRNTVDNKGDIIPYGNNIYYFDYIQRDFSKALSKFLDDHPELEVVSTAGDGTGAYGIDQDYHVVFKPKTCAQSVATPIPVQKK